MRFNLAIANEAWLEEAVCAQTDPDIFFPEKGGSTRAPKSVCAVCPVTNECLQYALDHDERFGIWGGVSERDRRRITNTVAKLIDHGITQTEVARRIGVTPATVNYYVMLLDLSEEELAEIEAGAVSLGDARTAVRKARASDRTDYGRPTRGRPPVVEPGHFNRDHPLAESVEEYCTHTQRPYPGRSVHGCGQCWEEVIREDAIANALQAAS